MSDFASFIEKQMNSFFGDAHFDDFIHKELVPLSHIKEKHSSWILEVDLPLVDKKNIEITLLDEHLTVKAKLTKIYCISRGSSVTEFDYFKKTIKLPSGINTKQISAIFKNGILRITMPRLANGKKISIE
ncbi:MAG: Hsp20/alpha crystallin family protein [Thaumarchaeota archaeon]|nr:Hsp20/alpha crystallin family protein [Nitrososphaerota archaeon]